MQQWYKRDIGKRFYLYHALNTGLQLEELPMKRIVLDRQTRKMKKAKDYQALEPVITLVWMMRRLRRVDLPQDDVTYIEEEKTFWEEVDRLENGIYQDGKKTGLKEGRKKGRKKGREEGRQEGREEGEKIGIEKGVEKIALNMLAKGMSPEDVAVFTGLSLDKVNQLLD